MSHMLMFVYMAGLVATTAVSYVNKKAELSAGVVIAAHLLWPLSLTVVLLWAVFDAAVYRL